MRNAELILQFVVILCVNVIKAVVAALPFNSSTTWYFNSSYFHCHLCDWPAKF